MNYDYRVLNTNRSLAFSKRAILYLAILMTTIAFALIVLFILFEKYRMLFLPAGILLISALIGGLVGRNPSVFSYHFAENELTIEGNGRRVALICLADVEILKNAEKSDFLNKKIIKFTFIENRIVLKNAVNYNSIPVQSFLVKAQNKQYILGLDEYALSLIRGGKNDAPLL